MQRYYLAVQERYGQARDLGVSLALLCKTTADPMRLTEDLSCMVRRHVSLCSSLRDGGGEVGQELRARPDCIIDLHRADDCEPASGVSSELLRWYTANGVGERFALSVEALRERHRSHTFDLFSAPPIKGDVLASAGVVAVLLRIHHIACDVHSLGLLTSEVRSAGLRRIHQAGA